KPRTAGSAAISAPGRFKSKSARCVVMGPTLAAATVRPGSSKLIEPAVCGESLDCEPYRLSHGFDAGVRHRRHRFGTGRPEGRHRLRPKSGEKGRNILTRARPRLV